MAKNSNSRGSLSPKDYPSLVDKIPSADASRKVEEYLKEFPHFKNLADSLPCCLYIVDYTNQTYIYVSESSEAITGYTAHEHLSMNYQGFLKKCMHPEDAALFESQVFSNFIASAKQISNDDIKHCRFSLNYRLVRKDTAIIKILQQSVVLEANPQGYPLLSMGILTDITQHKLDDKMILAVSSYDREKGFRSISSNSYSSNTIKFTPREKEIIRHIVYGHSSDSISKLLTISSYTVNAHRRNIYEKTKAKNVAELISFAVSHGLA